DFADLLRKENGGMLRGVTESDMLTTCVVLDTLLSLEQLGLRREVCHDRRYDAILGAVRKHFRAWKPATDLPSPPAVPEPARARRGSGPLCEIGDARELSYVWGLLLQAGVEGLPARRLSAAADDLVRTLTARRRGRDGPDIMQVLYAA